jgi:hypothetical protein
LLTPIVLLNPVFFVSIESEKHKNNGKRKTRCDKVLEPKCKHCEYKTNNLTCMKVHCLTQHSTHEERKKEFKYYCDKCDFGTYAEILFTRHCETKKHIQTPHFQI